MSEFSSAFNEALQEGREDWRKAFFLARDYTPARGSDPSNPTYLDSTDAPKGQTTLGTNPTIQRLLELAEPVLPGFMKPSKEEVAARKAMGLGLKDSAAGKAGQILGTLGNDVLNDSTRGIWWLLNAPQAVANVVNEEVLNRVNPDLFSSEVIRDAPNSKNPQVQGKPYKVVSNNDFMEIDELIKQQIDNRGEGGKPLLKSDRAESDFQRARNYRDPSRGLNDGLIDPVGTKRKGIGTSRDGDFYTRRMYAPGQVAALGVPAGIAINAGVGLLNPLGGSGGYSAALPSDEDPSKTSNVIGEIAAKYILGRTGNLLPYDEFSKVRPDVSREDYNRYKAFKYEKGLDLDITDGDFTLPTGVLKGTVNGIHGPEVQFLGRSLPLLTTLLPTAGAIAGTALGARRSYRTGDQLAKMKSMGQVPPERTAIRDGLIGGSIGLAAGSAAGLIAEEARRRAGGIASEQLEGNYQ